MKKLLLLVFVCSVSTNMIAQKTKAEKPVTSPQSALSVNDIAPPEPPPPPPPPPAPPAPPLPIEQVKFTPPVIVNDKGYDLSVHYNNGNNMVYAKKNGVTEKIYLAKWNTNETYYEKKYGKLPPPPPPAAPKAPPAPPEKIN